MFTPHHDTQLLYDYLIAHQDKGIISWDELSAVVGYQIQRGSGYSRLRSAINKAKNENQIVFETVRGQGVSKTTGAELVDNRAAGLASVRRRARIEQSKLACVKFTELDDAAKQKHNALAAQYGVIRQVATNAANARIREIANGQAPSVDATLRLFIEKS